MGVSSRPLILELDSPAADLETVGGKGASLARMAAAHLPVPPGFHVTTRAYRRFVDENHLADRILAAAGQAQLDNPARLESAAKQIRSLISRGAIPDDIANMILEWVATLGGDAPLAVRSSGTAEDLPGMSFAGQQETFLNVRGNDRVLDAVKRCWASLWTAQAIGYRLRNHIPPEDVALAVVIQQLILADAAGILFTANPVTGDRDKLVINAAWGLGEAVVGGHVIPDTFIVNKQTATLESHDISDKGLMTIPSPGGTRTVPVPTGKREQAALSVPQALELSRFAIQIEDLYDQPMDIEWALQDGHFFILQARPITALPQPPPRLDWRLPRSKGKYMRANVIELLPDPLSPLFASLGLATWNDAMHHLGRSIGMDLPDFMPEKPLVTINGYAYLDSGLIASGSPRYMLALPRLVRGFATGQSRWAEQARPRYLDAARTWVARDLSVTSAAQLLDGARQIVRAAAEYYLTVESGILPMSKMAETFFPLVYSRLVKHKDDPPALALMLGFDSMPIQAEKSLYDLAMWARGNTELAHYLASASGSEVASAYQSPDAPIRDADSWREFRRRFGNYLDRFGHAIFDLDFAKPLPADDPTPVIETLKHFIVAPAQNPQERQADSASERERATGSILRRLKGPPRRWFERFLLWAQRYTFLRENALADVGLGWPALRRLLLEIGRRLAEADAIARPDDVFWLEMDELQAAAHALDVRQPTRDFRGPVTGRRAKWEQERVVTPPVSLPVKGGARFWGIDWSFVMPADTEQAGGKVIRGIGASPGQVTGTACVIHDPAEFSRMRHGDILVARITTPAWTPLFALASGVVTDVGGLLSHSSIVAREYRIPAVLGTGVATERIHSGQRITVDGASGIVTIEN